MLEYMQRLFPLYVMERNCVDMDAPQLSQPEQKMSNQIRQVYEQTQQYLGHSAEPHGALMFIDTQIRTLEYMLPIAAQLWKNPVLVQQANDVLAYMYQIRPAYQAEADRTPKPPSIQQPRSSL